MKIYWGNESPNPCQNLIPVSHSAGQYPLTVVSTSGCIHTVLSCAAHTDGAHGVLPDGLPCGPSVCGLPVAGSSGGHGTPSIPSLFSASLWEVSSLRTYHASPLCHKHLYGNDPAGTGPCELSCKLRKHANTSLLPWHVYFKTYKTKREGIMPVGEEFSLTSGKCFVSITSNRQEGILSSVSPAGHWLTSGHSTRNMTFAKSGFSLMSLSTLHEAPNYSLLSPRNTSLSSILCYSDTASQVT